MTKEQFKKLNRGDLIKGAYTGNEYIVMANYGGRVTAVNTVDLTNHVEWRLVAKASFDFNLQNT